MFSKLGRILHRFRDNALKMQAFQFCVHEPTPIRL